MDRLASCYFCGVAVDAPLEEYPVVPGDLRPSVENQQTVVLCPQCRRKLSTIVDSVVAAATDPGQTTLSSTESVDPEGEGAGESNPAVDPETATKAETAATEPDAESVGDTDSEDSVIEGFGHEEPSLVDLEGTTSDEPAATDAANSSADERKPTAGDSQESAGEPSAAGGGFEPEQTMDDESESERSTPGETDEAGTEALEQSVPRAAYNHVVRLLQNRAFPLDVEEIATVADSAYGIDRHETETIIDALVERGVIERDGEQLFRSADT